MVDLETSTKTDTTQDHDMHLKDWIGGTWDEQGQILTQLRSNRTDTSLRLIHLMFVDKHPQRQKISISINMNYLFFWNLLWRNFLWQEFPKSKNLMTFLIFTAFIKMFNFMIWWSWKTQWPPKANQAVSGRYHGIIETQVLLRLEVSHKIFAS